MSTSVASAAPQRLRLGLARATGYPVTVLGFALVVLVGLVGLVALLIG